MAVLTESKIRKLLKTTDFKEKKRLILEPGTIITPSAKSYLTNITVEYQGAEGAIKVAPAEDIPTNVVQPVKSNRATLQWQLAVDQLTSKLLFDQKFCDSLKEEEMVVQLASWIQTLQDFKKMDFLGRHSLQEDTLALEVKVWEESYSQDSFVPLYSEEETVLRLYARYLDVKELELQRTVCLNDYLLMDEYHALVKKCRLIANEIWLAMIRQIERTSKERRS